MAADIGLIGLAVMGENLVLNLERNGFKVAVYNRTTEKTDAFLRERALGKQVVGVSSLKELTQKLSKPRRILIMVKAGAAVDKVIDGLTPHLEPGDILIDGGNSHYPDTIRRTRDLKEKGLLFVGTGISGGEEGALKGPCLMPGGDPDAWPSIQELLQRIAAKTDDGAPCCDWVGGDGAGHFVKMVHNGIEYGDMQLICETYHLMRDGLEMTNPDMQEVFARWNQGPLNSYLIEITADILAFRDADGDYPLDQILDAAGQKGTGKWTAAAALDLGQPLSLIGEAVFARCLSSLKEERVRAAERLEGPSAAYSGDRKALLEDLEQALYASKIASYAQGFQLLQAAAAAYEWRLDYGRIAQLWRGGCIIRSGFLDQIRDAFQAEPPPTNLLLAPFFHRAVQEALPGWRRVVTAAVNQGIPLPAIGSALAYFDGYRCARLPANLLQAQRDYFGAHSYERIDQPRGTFFHTNWTGRGGATPAGAYSV